jgi:hypothetical protein
LKILVFGATKKKTFILVIKKLQLVSKGLVRSPTHMCTQKESFFEFLDNILAFKKPHH